MSLDLRERRPFVYEPPPGLPLLPSLPRSCWTAYADDGAALDVYVWGSTLGEPWLLEVRRYGAPELVPGAAVSEPDALPPAAPRLEELQELADRLVPPGIVFAVMIASAPPADGRYTSPCEYQCVRIGQFGVLEARPSPGLAIGGRA